jgi:hypothetical protein
MYKLRGWNLPAIAFLLLIMNAFSLEAQDEKMKAIFVYNFTRYIGWPETQDKFVIYILGKSAISAELQEIATKKKVGSTTIEVKSINSPEEIIGGQMVYVTATKMVFLPSFLAKSQSEHLLIITEKAGACKSGGGINFVNKDGKLTFEISRNNLAKSGLTVSSTLYTLGTEVNE